MSNVSKEMRSLSGTKGEAGMIAAVVEKCAGLDVHRDSIMACLMWGAAQAEGQWEIQRFGTSVRELERLKQWLLEKGCLEVVMESTGAYGNRCTT